MSLESTCWSCGEIRHVTDCDLSLELSGAVVVGRCPTCDVTSRLTVRCDECQQTVEAGTRVTVLYVEETGRIEHACAAGCRQTQRRKRQRQETARLMRVVGRVA